MQRNYILVVFAILLNLSAAKADSLRDSIGVENINGKKIILHQVVAKDTYYSISRRYGIGPKVIMAYNNDKYLSIGVVIKVPTDAPFQAEAAKKDKNPPQNNTAAPAADENTSLTEYAVQKKDNLNMLANRFGTTVDEIKRVNNLKTINLQIGQLLKIPVKQENAEETTSSTPLANTTPAVTPANGTMVKNTAPPVQQTAPAQDKVKQDIPVNKKPEESRAISPPTKTVQETQPQDNSGRDKLVVHTVAGNETMYSISAKYNLTMDQLKAKNNLTTNSLYVGQKLLISGQYPVKREDADDDESPADTLDNVKNPSLRLPPSRYGLSQMDEKGTGIWIMDPDLDSSKMLVLHRTAPVGTIMKITNPMTNRSTFAKVIGKFTENESTKDTIIVMTKAVADALGALDKRFLCNLTYSGQANEQ